MLYDLIKDNDDLRRFFIIVNTALATLVGMIEDNVLQDGFMAIEEYDMIEWLQKHGCVTAVSAITLGMYDACFGYENGDPGKKRMGAGSTLYGGLRLMFTYRGALMWWMNAGMGETIMSPLYLVLKSRGVKFKFFHKVTACISRRTRKRSTRSISRDPSELPRVNMIRFFSASMDSGMADRAAVGAGRRGREDPAVRQSRS